LDPLKPDLPQTGQVLGFREEVEILEIVLVTVVEQEEELELDDEDLAVESEVEDKEVVVVEEGEKLGVVFFEMGVDGDLFDLFSIFSGEVCGVMRGVSSILVRLTGVSSPVRSITSLNSSSTQLLLFPVSISTSTRLW